VSIRIPVLMYHEVVAGGQDQLARSRTHADYILPAEHFAEQMRFLAEHGFHPLKASALARAVAAQETARLPRGAVVITFDDGFAGNYDQALPILREFGMTASFFVTVAQIGRPAMMSWGQLERVAAAGMEIGSHLMHHVIMSELSRAEAFEELSRSRSALQEHLDQAVTVLSLPNGSYHRRYPELARESGYRGGFCSRLGYVGAASDPFLLERVPVLATTSLVRFARLASGDTRILTGARVRRQAHALLNALVGESTVNRWYQRLNRVSAPHDQEG